MSCPRSVAAAAAAVATITASLVSPTTPPSLSPILAPPRRPLQTLEAPPCDAIIMIHHPQHDHQHDGFEGPPPIITNDPIHHRNLRRYLDTPSAAATRAAAVAMQACDIDRKSSSSCSASPPPLQPQPLPRCTSCPIATPGPLADDRSGALPHETIVVAPTLPILASASNTTSIDATSTVSIDATNDAASAAATAAGHSNGGGVSSSSSSSSFLVDRFQWCVPCPSSNSSSPSSSSATSLCTTSSTSTSVTTCTCQPELGVVPRHIRSQSMPVGAAIGEHAVSTIAADIRTNDVPAVQQQHGVQAVVASPDASLVPPTSAATGEQSNPQFSPNSGVPGEASAVAPPTSTSVSTTTVAAPPETNPPVASHAITSHAVTISEHGNASNSVATDLAKIDGAAAHSCDVSRANIDGAHVDHRESSSSVVAPATSSISSSSVASSSSSSTNASTASSTLPAQSSTLPLSALLWSSTGSPTPHRGGSSMTTTLLEHAAHSFPTQHAHMHPSAAHLHGYHGALFPPLMATPHAHHAALGLPTASSSSSHNAYNDNMLFTPSSRHFSHHQQQFHHLLHLSPSKGHGAIAPMMPSDATNMSSSIAAAVMLAGATAAGSTSSSAHLTFTAHAHHSSVPEWWKAVPVASSSSSGSSSSSTLTNRPPPATAPDAACRVSASGANGAAAATAATAATTIGSSRQLFPPVDIPFGTSLSAVDESHATLAPFVGVPSVYGTTNGIPRAAPFDPVRETSPLTRYYSPLLAHSPEFSPSGHHHVYSYSPASVMSSSHGPSAPSMSTESSPFIEIRSAATAAVLPATYGGAPSYVAPQVVHGPVSSFTPQPSARSSRVSAVPSSSSAAAAATAVVATAPLAPRHHHPPLSTPRHRAHPYDTPQQGQSQLQQQQQQQRGLMPPATVPHRWLHVTIGNAHRASLTGRFSTSMSAVGLSAHTLPSAHASVASGFTAPPTLRTLSDSNAKAHDDGVARVVAEAVSDVIATRPSPPPSTPGAVASTPSASASPLSAALHARAIELANMVAAAASVAVAAHDSEPLVSTPGAAPASTSDGVVSDHSSSSSRSSPSLAPSSSMKEQQQARELIDRTFSQSAEPGLPCSGHNGDIAMHSDEPMTTTASDTRRAVQRTCSAADIKDERPRRRRIASSSRSSGDHALLVSTRAISTMTPPTKSATPRKRRSMTMTTMAVTATTNANSTANAHATDAVCEVKRRRAHSQSMVDQSFVMTTDGATANAAASGGGSDLAASSHAHRAQQQQQQHHHHGNRQACATLHVAGGPIGQHHDSAPASSSSSSSTTVSLRASASDGAIASAAAHRSHDALYLQRGANEQQSPQHELLLQQHGSSRQLHSSTPPSAWSAACLDALNHREAQAFAHARRSALFATQRPAAAQSSSSQAPPPSLPLLSQAQPQAQREAIPCDGVGDCSANNSHGSSSSSSSSSSGGVAMTIGSNRSSSSSPAPCANVPPGPAHDASTTSMASLAGFAAAASSSTASSSTTTSPSLSSMRPLPSMCSPAPTTPPSAPAPSPQSVPPRPCAWSSSSFSSSSVSSLTVSSSSSSSSTANRAAATTSPTSTTTTDDAHVADEWFARFNRPMPRRCKLAARSVSVLRTYFLDHLPHPFPGDFDKAHLIRSTGLSNKQIVDWFTNNRKRYWRTYERQLIMLGCELTNRAVQACQCGRDAEGNPVHAWHRMWD